jgi:tRNA pseudouridine65 synthase
VKTDALQILYRDDDIVAVDKPAGMLVHRTAIAQGTEFAVQTLRRQIGAWVQPVHRLDRPTSGVLLFALHKEATRRLTDAFTGRAVKKTYWAVVRGHPDAVGRVDHPLCREDGVLQEAQTEWRRLETVELAIAVGRYPSARYSWIELSPETGRRHQLRRHCAHIRHPIVGDTTHGDGRHNRLFREHFGSHRLLLFAQALALSHPMTGDPLFLEAPVAPSLAALCHEFDWPVQPHRRAISCGKQNASGAR